MGDNRKKNNKNYDKACTDLKLIEKRRWKFYATNLATKPSPLVLKSKKLVISRRTYMPE
jgi:hypothetical protein